MCVCALARRHFRKPNFATLKPPGVQDIATHTRQPSLIYFALYDQIVGVGLLVGFNARAGSKDRRPLDRPFWWSVERLAVVRGYFKTKLAILAPKVMILLD